MKVYPDFNKEQQDLFQIHKAENKGLEEQTLDKVIDLAGFKWCMNRKEMFAKQYVAAHSFKELKKYQKQAHIF